MEVPPANYGNPDRDIHQALISLKKGSQLIKYSRKGKPKLCSFRLSNDETKLIWLSHKKERNLYLTSIIRILPGQRTAVFKRYPRPEKDYLSFSLLYNSGERSLDLICKSQAEVEAWFTSLSALISTGGHRRRGVKDEEQSDGAPFSDEVDSFYSAQSSYGGATSLISRLNTKAAFDDTDARVEPSLSFRKSDVGTGHANMQHPRISNGDISRLSVSSAPSCSSQGSGHDEIESLGDVYIWGEVWSDGISPDGRRDSAPSKIDVLIPKPLESNVVLDVHQIACGSRNMALVTRQGEVFTWGEECGGRLGHGVSMDVSRPRLVESLAPSNIDSVSCGESHSCAINTWGDLFTWGTGLLGHGGGGDVGHWIPKRVSGPLEGLQVLSVACGAWHSALTTSNGRIYTFGDGTFGALGHGDRESAGYPREIEGLSGLRGIKVGCGVWHTAAIVEVMEQAVVSTTNVVSRKLFTWGDGDKYQLGQGDKEARLLPTCVPSLIDYSFHQLACGDSITVALTTSGHVFTMGSSAHGQLGNPQSDGKLPCLVQDRLVGELVEEIACGSHHVVVLTSRSEVYSWGRGGNGRLGHGDRDDRKTPAVVEALRDRHVRSISCGSNFTACICVHKWVSGADQSVCTACRLTFGFTKKRHNCYNCGLVHCHACSSKKALKAALAPTPSKPHRVCDSCYSKLKAAELGMPSAAARKTAASRQSIDSRDIRFDRGEARSSSRLLLAPTLELGSHRLDVIRYAGKNEQRTSSSQVSSPSHMAFTSSMSLIQTALKPAAPPAASSRLVNPYYTWRPSPSQSASLEFSGSMVETMKKTNEHLDREVLKLQGQVKSLKQKLEQQGSVARMALKKAEEASSIATDEHAKFSAAVELMKTFQARMNDMEDSLPSDLVDNFRAMLASSESSLRSNRGGVLALSSSSATQRDDLECTTGVIAQENGKTSAVNYINEASSDHGGSMENGSSRSPRTSANSHGEVQLTEQFEPGVYVTAAQLRDGTKVFKRVRFSKRRFAEQQAEEWWRENQDRVIKKYNYAPGHNRSYSTSHAISETPSSHAA